MEDGLLDVAIVERMPTGNLVAEAIGHRLLARDTEGVTHVCATDIDIDGRGDPVTFSRDGELAEHERLSITASERTLDLRVGPEYVPHPERWPRHALRAERRLYAPGGVFTVSFSRRRRSATRTFSIACAVTTV